ncbi:hypothetical protein FACS1894127_5300 [Clostridia bacterium]|nr:hypothetical protein FACS1894127_5300 [Clostridia bacterium]
MKRQIKMVGTFAAALLLTVTLSQAFTGNPEVLRIPAQDTPAVSVAVNQSGSLLSGLAKILKLQDFLSVARNAADNLKWRKSSPKALPHVRSIAELKSLLNVNNYPYEYGIQVEYDVQMESIIPSGGSSDGSGGGSASADISAPAATAGSNKSPVNSPEAKAYAPSGGDSSSDYSQTNVQVAGVDEGDVAKTDGRYIYSLGYNTLHIFKVEKGEISKESSIELKDHNCAELYLAGNKLVVTGTRYDSMDSIIESIPVVGRYLSQGIYHPTKSYSFYKVYDISDRKSPKLQQSFELEGNPAATRLIDGTLYFVVNRYISYYNSDNDMLPSYRDSEKNAKIQSLPVGDIAYFPDSYGYDSYMMVGAMDLSEAREVSFETYLNDGANFYMNLNNLYIARSNWSGAGDTDLYRFDVRPESISYASAGSVPGKVLNQYSMDEHNGYFRIATTNGDGNTIYVLDRDLKKVGSTPQLAKGESIQSVRFMGDIAYMVTYLQTDPLYAVDLSIPSAPVVLGELKIPGFSTYLHPVEGEWLVGFGRHTTEIFYRDSSGREVVTGTQDMGQKISLFDVSDPKNLKEADIMLLGMDTWSEAFNNPRALMVDPGRKLFGFVMTGYDKGIAYDAIRLVGVANDKLKDVAEIRSDAYRHTNARLLFIGDALYDINGDEVVAYEMQGYKEIGRIKGSDRATPPPVYYIE